MDYLTYSDFEKFIRGAYLNLGKKREIVNKLNVFPVPDGDTGTNMYLTVRTAIEEIDKRKPKNLKELGKVICEGALVGGRGNSGVILSQIFKGFFEMLDNYEEVNALQFSQALQNGSKVAYKAVIKPVEGTILTVIRSIADSSSLLFSEEKDILIFLQKCIDDGKQALAHTPDLLPVLKEAGVIDAGGQGLIFLLEGGLSALKGEELESLFEESVEEISKHVKGEALKYRYDTVLLTESYRSDVENLKKELEIFGDSTVVAKANELIKIHIHTNEPYKVIEQIMSFGPIKEARIEDMQVEQDEFLNTISKTSQKKESRLPFSIVTIAQGKGFNDIFLSLGVEQVIEGGQTMNPSINDILSAIENCTKDNIVVFPNNPNIILAAEEAKKLSKKKNVQIIPSVSVVQSIPVILSFNSVETFDENLEHSSVILQNMHTVSVTYSIRDTKINGLSIQNGDIIGMFDDEILAKNKNAEDIILEIFDKKKEVINDSEFVGIYYGEGVSEADAQRLSQLIKDKFPEIDVDISNGGQPYYYYLLSVE